MWLQCPLLPLRRYCRLESFAGSFYQYPLEYNFKASLSSVWYAGVGVGSQPTTCSDDLWVFYNSVRSNNSRDRRSTWDFFFLSFPYLICNISNGVEIFSLRVKHQYQQEIWWNTGGYVFGAIFYLERMVKTFCVMDKYTTIQWWVGACVRNRSPTPPLLQVLARMLDHTNKLVGIVHVMAGQKHTYTHWWIPRLQQKRRSNASADCCR